MSVFSVVPQDGNPVTVDTLDDVCKRLGVTIKDEEREDYHKLLAVFHESAEELMAMPYEEPFTDIKRFPRKNVHFPDRSDNEFGAWAWKCSIKDEEENKSGRLYGKTIAIKDNIGVKDVPMLLGSNFIKDYTPGIVGFKPTFGLIPYTGCGSNEPTNDHLGPMTRTVADNALLLEVLAGSDGIDDRFACPFLVPRYFANLKQSKSKDLSHVRIGIISESLTSPVLDARVKDTFLKAAEQFRVLGALVEEVSVPLHKRGPAIWTGISKTGGFLAKTSGSFGRRGYAMQDLNSLMYPLKQENWDEAYVSTKNIYLNGAYAASAFPHLLAKATNLSRNLRSAYDEALKKYDVLITPTLPYLATPHADPDATPLGQIVTQVGLTANTCQFNQTGHPALTLPIGLLEIQEGPLAGSGTKLPVGVQIVGRWWAEDTVLQVAYAWEQGNDWEKM
ncbi:hypothetical protein BLS_007973 [Venturia inaequalis]|uniref:Amidase domain-containing protein n=1 Tax=Venturia inaequalis TaxID=5025 RepID=A0A8H3U7M5_VENIN|nr:hypothetical protein BLS_007973 [Venturia inaequalis]